MVWGPFRFPNRWVTAMSDKSPRNTMTKKTGKSLKDKRADKRAKSTGDTSNDIITSAVKKK